MGHCAGLLRVWRLDSPPTPLPTWHHQFATRSTCGPYIVTAHRRGSIVTITNLLSRTTSQLIDTDMVILALILIGNVLLVKGPEETAAWSLTVEGVVEGVFGNRRAGHSDSIWTVPTSVSEQWFLAAAHTGATDLIRNIPHTYDTETRKATSCYTLPWEITYWGHLLGRGFGDNWRLPQARPQDGWLKDFKGKHKLWVPTRWRTCTYCLDDNNIITLHLGDQLAAVIIF